MTNVSRTRVVRTSFSFAACAAGFLATAGSASATPTQSPLLISDMPAVQAADTKVKAELSKPAKVGENELKVTLTDAKDSPVAGAEVSLAVSMKTMDMGTEHPKATEKGNGIYIATIGFSMQGPWHVDVTVKHPGWPEVRKGFDFETTAGASEMEMGPMKGRLGDWSMSKEGSGTSWLPESSPMFMKMLPKTGGFDLNVMGFFTLNYSNAGGPRGDKKFYSNSMPMLMASRELGGGVLGLSLMASLDPIFNGEYGYPDLFQTGETAHGNKLVDYQHPHDLISELTASYSHPIGGGLTAFVYGGPVGEPALGGPTFAHRPSGMEIPEAPITHHWFDSTHISWGVLTAGLNSKTWQLEGSAFNGHEPDENRYSPDPIALNSASGRFTYNPTKNLSFNASYGFIDSPESTSPGVDQHRITAAALWSQPIGKDNLSVSALFGRNITEGKSLNARVLEATYLSGPTSIFARWENVDKDELIGTPDGTYNVNKVLFGAVHNFAHASGFDFGLGAYAGVYAFPNALEPYYGRNPVTLGVWLRVRPSRMSE